MRPTARRVLMGIALLAIVAIGARTVDWRAVFVAVAGASIPLVLLTACATFLSTLIKGVRWWLFLRRSTSLRLGQVMRLTIGAAGLNSLLFAHAGEVMRVGAASRISGAPVTTILGSLASDKVVEFLSFATMVIVAIVVQPIAILPRGMVWIVAAGVIILAVLLLVGRVSTQTRVFLVETRQRLRGPDARIGYLISLISWPAQVATYGLGALAINVHVPLAGTVAAVVAVNIAGVIRSTPGNVGVFQVMYVLAVAPYGIPRPQAIAAALLIQAVQMLSAVGAGALAAPDWMRKTGLES